MQVYYETAICRQNQMQSAAALAFECLHSSRISCREATRELYAPYESNMKYCSSDVYQHEMPGGQYTNLKFQAASLGLGDSWGKVQQSYAAANRALGDIVKVSR